MMRRQLRAWQRRLEDADVEDVAELVQYGHEVEGALVAVVAAMRERGVSWTTIAGAFGTTRQAAQQRFGERIAR
jgi:hypothetical protein